MATNHTENYNLNLWEPGDSFLRSEFNENTTKLDAALKALDTKVNTKADAAIVPRLHIMTWTGDGEKTHTLTFPFQPRLVLVSPAEYDTGRVLLFSYGQTSAMQMDGNMRSQSIDLTWTANSVQIKARRSDAFPSDCFNANGKKYTALLIG